MLIRAVNTRNVCQLLNAVSPCSVTDFKDAALEYICLNVEGILENQYVIECLSIHHNPLTFSSLLDELDDDLMLELDEVVRQNQLACLPVSKSGKTEAELFQTYPELPGRIYQGRKAKLDSITIQSRTRDEEPRYGSFSKGKGASVDDSGLAQDGRPRSSRGRSSTSKSPSLKARSSAADLMFDMDEGEVADTNLLAQVSPTHDLPDRQVLQMSQNPSASPTADQFWSSSEMRGSAAGNDIDVGSTLPLIDQSNPHCSDRTVSKAQTPILRDIKPWGSAPLNSHKFDMKDIMAQASSNRVSNISSGLSNQAQKAALGAGSLPKMSQRARKKQQQQQQPLLAVSGSSPGVNHPAKSNNHVRDESSKSPWHITLPVPKISLKDILGADGDTSLALKPNFTNLSESPLTLRQTVPGSMSITREQAVVSSSADRSVSAVVISKQAETHPRTSPSSRSLPTTGPTNHALSRSSNTTPIHSIRHQPHLVEPSLQLSMADILSQQQTEKEIFRDAGFKRSLQEIQEEQAFQEWWDEESRKVRNEEAGRKGAVGGERRGARATRTSTGRGGGRGRGRGKDGIGSEVGEEAGRGKRSGGGPRGRGRGRKESADKITEPASG